MSMSEKGFITAKGRLVGPIISKTTPIFFIRLSTTLAPIAGMFFIGTIIKPFEVTCRILPNFSNKAPPKLIIAEKQEFLEFTIPLYIFIQKNILTFLFWGQNF